MQPMRRLVINSFIVTMLTITLIDGMPSAGAPHDRAKEWLDPWLDATALWQGEWVLFAPNVMKRNARVSARLEDSSGIELRWHSPRFQDMSVAGRFRAFREGEFFDNIRNNEYSGAWESVADYLARTEYPSGLEGHRLVSVRLTRHWWDIPPPGKGIPQPEEQGHEFYKKNYQP
jgi:hypothetical protein